MLIKKKDTNKILIYFLLTHLIVWTLVPSLSNTNLPLDLIEALSWGKGFPFGFHKHPPLSLWFPQVFFQVFGNQDWVYYFLSQIFVVISFIFVWKLSEELFNNKIYSLLSVLLLEAFYFYNFTTPEFNVNICQLPFWSLTVYYCWRGIKKNHYSDWLIFGAAAALGILSKYSFIYLLISIDFLFIYFLYTKKINLKCLISLVSFFIILAPHIIWLSNNDYTTIFYAVHRGSIGYTDFFNSHILNPLSFLGKQIVIFIPFVIMIFFLVSKFKFKINHKDKKLIFLIAVNIIPVVLIFLTSLIIGAEIRTMWMTPFYLFTGTLFIYLFQRKIILTKIKYFFSIFLLFFILSPLTYLYISISETDKRTDYPGKKISQIVQNKWEENFINEIGVVGGDAWHGGNLAYYLNSKPKWDDIAGVNKSITIRDKNSGFVLIGNADILSQICNGIFLKIEGQGICMLGRKK